MDPLTQGALGAAWAQPSARRSKLVAASLVGCAAGMAADLDLFIRSSRDPILALEFHRHFTHSLLFIPFGGLLVALLLLPLVRRQISFAACLGFSVLGYASHGLLDACTSYGTQLYWPFSNTRVAWDLVSVVDPLFTLPLLAMVLLAVKRKSPRWVAIGLVWCAIYLCLGAVQSQRAEGAIIELARERGHTPVGVRRLPTFGNVLLWRTIYEYDGQYYVDAVRVGIEPKSYPGVALPSVDTAVDFPWLDPRSQQARDIDRFRWFADDYLVRDTANPNLILDLRFSLVPNRIGGFWGIELNPDATQDDHVSYVTMRRRTMAEGAEFLRLLVD